MSDGAPAQGRNRRVQTDEVTGAGDGARVHVPQQRAEDPRQRTLREHLARQKIGTEIYYPVPLHRQTAWLRHYGESPALPRAERLAGEILSLPVFPDLTDAEVETVAGAVRAFFGR